MKTRHLLAVWLFALTTVPVLSAHPQRVRSQGIAGNPAVAAPNRAHGDWRNHHVSTGGAPGPSGASATQSAYGAGNSAGKRGGHGVGFVPLPPAH
ncbi:hypothetical protein [Paraburkholderia sp. HD33-4]|uniref:hypothetical protein n=1 Tax=Paraburkholderia sp. HD33-4 TaxID=2883242 RepID=UPI001F2CC890|nr:hypothetical protein [Paraburkholderia sp. HD33-4]